MLPDASSLDRTKLNFFIAGPGPGEGLAIALPEPEGGWIFVDGCRADTGGYPLHVIWSRYKRDGEPVQGIVLTHPHKDHYAGMVELIDLTGPRWLACVATHHRGEVRALRDDPVVEDYPGLLVGPVKDLLARIQHEWGWKGTGRVELRAGQQLPLGRKDVTIDVVAPDDAGARAFFRAPNLAERLRTRANELSAVLHVRYGSTRLVLGGDLPESDHGVGPRTGWTKVLATYSGLPASHVLKIPHHGSDGAMHAGMVGPHVAPPGARWTLTPFQGGPTRPLPRLRDGRGVEALLNGIEQVHLTSLPTGWTAKTPPSGRVPLDALEEPAPIPVPGATFKARVGLIRCGALDAVWLFTMDNAGCCVAEYRGDQALVITPRRASAARPPRGRAPRKRPRRI